MLLFAEIGTEGGFVGAVTAIALGFFTWMKVREKRRILFIETKSKQSENDRAELRKKVNEQGQEIDKLKSEIENCHNDRRHQDATINRLEEWRIDSLHRQNELYRRVEELENELAKHRPRGKGH